MMPKPYRELAACLLTNLHREAKRLIKGHKYSEFVQVLRDYEDSPAAELVYLIKGLPPEQILRTYRDMAFEESHTRR